MTIEHLNNSLVLNLAQPEDENSVGLVSATGNGLKYQMEVKIISSAKLILNGNARFNERDGFYFNTVQPYQHHGFSSSWNKCLQFCH